MVYYAIICCRVVSCFLNLPDICNHYSVKRTKKKTEEKIYKETVGWRHQTPRLRELSVFLEMFAYLLCGESVKLAQNGDAAA